MSKFLLGDNLSSNETILRGLAAMARALTASNGWTPEAREGYERASKAVPLLGESIHVGVKES